MFSLICAWINDWVNNRKAGGRAHYDVTVMIFAHAKYPHRKIYERTKHWLPSPLDWSYMRRDKQSPLDIPGHDALRDDIHEAGILLIGPWETNFSEILIGIYTFSFNKLHLKTSSAKWRIFCLGLNVLKESLITRLCVGDHRHWVLDALDTDRTGITGLGVWLPLMLMGVVHTGSVIYIQKTVETAIDFMHDVELGADGSILHMAVGWDCWWPGVTR